MNNELWVSIRLGEGQGIYISKVYAIDGDKFLVYFDGDGENSLRSFCWVDFKRYDVRLEEED